MDEIVKKMNSEEQIVFLFFKEFASLEGLLKESGYLVKFSVKDNRASVNWDDVKGNFRKYCIEHPDKISASENQAIKFFFEASPKKQTVDIKGNLEWKKPGKEEIYFYAISSLQRVRNNLFHGGKSYQNRLIGGVSGEDQRDYNLIKAGLEIIKLLKRII